MINYILQVILFQVLFLAIYDFFLSKETFFTKNRWYLLSTPIVSFLIPLIKIPTFQKTVSQEFFIQLPEIVLNPDKVIQEKVTTANFTTSINYLSILFWIGVALFSVLFLIKLIKIITFISKNETIKKSNFILILIPNQTKAFSFFKYIFLGKEVPKHQQEKVIQHELVHSQQKHSLDLLLFEILKIVMWFNPMIYFYQKRITLVHEYISDAVVSKSESKESYINNLLSNFFQVENIMFVNQFYKPTFIKKRITMMTKKQSKKMNQLKYLVLIPVLASMFFYVSCVDESSTEIIESKLELQKMHFLFKEGELKTTESSDKYSYFDLYFGGSIPSDFKKISLESLSSEERIELDELFQGAKERGSKISLDDYQIYQMKTGRKVLVHLFNPDVFKKDSTDSKIETEDVSFMVIDKAPTFPGCEEGDKACFSKNVQQHFANNFDADMPKTLGLVPGRKRIFIAFKIDKEGKVVDVQARAPHQEIKEEVLKVMNALPQMKPGEQDGKPVAVKYSIPFTIFIE